MDTYAYEIAPGILEKDWAEIEKKLEIAKKFAHAVHIDLMDGKFVPNVTFQDPTPFKKYSQDLKLELHMMVEEPMKYLKPFADQGFSRFVAHIETLELAEEFIAQAQLFGEVGIALDKETGVDAIDALNLEDLDSILFMTVKAGEAGQTLIPDMLEKVKEVREKITFERLALEVDGGIGESTILEARNAGANRFVATTEIWSAQNPEEEFRKLKELVESS